MAIYRSLFPSVSCRHVFSNEATRPLNQLAILHTISFLKRWPRNRESFPLLLDMVDSVSSNPLRSTKGVTHVHAAH
jgi:hypothetical protein